MSIQFKIVAGAIVLALFACEAPQAGRSHAGESAPTPGVITNDNEEADVTPGADRADLGAVKANKEAAKEENAPPEQQREADVDQARQHTAFQNYTLFVETAEVSADGEIAIESDLGPWHHAARWEFPDAERGGEIAVKFAVTANAVEVGALSNKDGSHYIDRKTFRAPFAGTVRFLAPSSEAISALVFRHTGADEDIAFSVQDIRPIPPIPFADVITEDVGFVSRYQYLYATERENGTQQTKAKYQKILKPRSYVVSKYPHTFYFDTSSIRHRSTRTEASKEYIHLIKAIEEYEKTGQLDTSFVTNGRVPDDLRPYSRNHEIRVKANIFDHTGLDAINEQQRPATLLARQSIDHGGGEVRRGPASDALWRKAAPAGSSLSASCG